VTTQLPALPEHEQDRWLTLREASDLLGVHYTTLRSWADRGLIPVFRTPGGHRRFRLSDVRRFLAARIQQHTPVAINGVMQQALLRVRSELERTPVETVAWRAHLSEEERQANRERGRRLFALALNYVLRQEQREELLEAGRKLGRLYGMEAVQAGLSLVEAGRAVQFFRRLILEAVRRDESLDPEDVRIRQMLAHFLDEVLYAVLEGYEEAKEQRRS